MTKVRINESSARKGFWSRVKGSDNMSVYGTAFVDGYEMGTVWVDYRGNYYLDQNSKSKYVHGRLGQLTSNSVKGLEREIRKAFIR